MTDVIFLSHDETRANGNFDRLRSQVPWAQHVSGISGIREAMIAAADSSQSEFFFLVDADNWVLDEFNQLFVERAEAKAAIYYATNDFGMTYGHGGIKYLSKSMLSGLSNSRYLDFSDRIFRGRYPVVPKVLSHHQLGEGFQRWRAIFRELTKNALRNEERLAEWLQNAEAKWIYDNDVMDFISQRSPNRIFSDINDYSMLRSIYEDRRLFSL